MDGALEEGEGGEVEQPKWRRTSRKLKERKAMTLEDKIGVFEKKAAEAMEEGGDGELITGCQIYRHDLGYNRRTTRSHKRDHGFVM